MTQYDRFTVMSCGIFHETDIPLLQKQKELFERYSNCDLLFSCVLGRKCGHPVDVKTLQGKVVNALPDIRVMIPDCSSDDASMAAAIPPMHGLRHSPLGKHFVVHSDLLAIRQFDLERIFDGYDIGGVRQDRGPNTYLWENMFYVDTRRIAPNMLDFSPCERLGVWCDTGGMLCDLLTRTRYLGDASQAVLSDDSSVDSLDIVSRANKEILKQMVRNKQQEKPVHPMELWNGRFLHYRSGSNWHRNQVLPWQDDGRRKNMDLLLRLM